MKHVLTFILHHRRKIDLLMIALSLAFTVGAKGEAQTYWAIATVIGFVLYIVDVPGYVHKTIVTRQAR